MGISEAHTAVYAAVKSGRLVRPEACEECGRERKVDAHHEDYEKPLDVVWLCRRCHVGRHAVASETKMVSFRLPLDLLERVTEAAEELGQTKTLFVTRALEKALGDGSIGDGPVQGQAGSMPARPPAPSRPSAGPLADRQAALNKAKGL